MAFILFFGHFVFRSYRFDGLWRSGTDLYFLFNLNDRRILNIWLRLIVLVEDIVILLHLLIESFILKRTEYLFDQFSDFVFDEIWFM